MPAHFAPGNYRYLPGVFQYSAGVAALPGYEIRRVRFRETVPLARGFERVAHYMTVVGRPLTALCACELRSSAQFSEEGFRAFNETYVAKLREWGLFDGRVNPVARSNVCPEIDPPIEPSFHAFAFTAVAPQAAPTFVIAGSGEVPEGRGSYAAHIVRRGETGTDAMREKARFVLAEMERRLGLLGFAWTDTTATQVYTVRDLHPFLADDIVRRGAGRAGLTWHFCRPPVRELEFEMDCRAITSEQAI
ncbi:MAG TPA: hypothetical protein VK456_09010 [Xanthobacteraceae bacterium]|nr:hypothetical protein [Xanthobacteraceae bacterium]